MSTYKIANKVKGIIRSYSSGPIGNTVATYNNEPFMRIEKTEATLTFTTRDVNADTADKRRLNYNHDTISQIQLTDVPLSDKMFSLLYIKNEDEPLFHKQEYYTSDLENKIYLNVAGSSPIIYQVFIYDQDGVLEKAYGEFDASQPLEVERTESNYSIYYSILGSKSFFLDKPNNVYLTLDLEILGNEDENTQDMCIHIEKASIQVNRNMRFNNSSNAVDLTFNVIYTGLDYITIA